MSDASDNASSTRRAMYSGRIILASERCRTSSATRAILFPGVIPAMSSVMPVRRSKLCEVRSIISQTSELTTGNWSISKRSEILPPDGEIGM